MTRCSDKLRYRDRVSALIASADLERDDDPKHPELRPYLCPVCRGWHLTSQERRE